jgi:hypothetical protein
MHKIENVFVFHYYGTIVLEIVDDRVLSLESITVVLGWSIIARRAM